jgi:hypothetical protein
MEENWRQSGYFSPSPPTLLAPARERMIFILSCPQVRERIIIILSRTGAREYFLVLLKPVRERMNIILSRAGARDPVLVLFAPAREQMIFILSRTAARDSFLFLLAPARERMILTISRASHTGARKNLSDTGAREYLETLGFVVLESMASGVPVSGAATGGNLDLIDDQVTGFLAPPDNTKLFVDRLSLLSENVSYCKKMGKMARKEAERWGWEAATSYLRNVQYEKALINFHSRVFGGFGRPGTAGMWQLLEWRIRGIIRRVNSCLRGERSVWRSVGRRLSFWRKRNNQKATTSSKPAALT